jgi:type II secretory pathway pseudopilin PulG
MGQQQLLLIILGVIIVGIAIAVGLSLFSAQSIQSNKDAIINDLNNIAAQAYQYRIRPSSMAGGNGSYTGFTIPSKMASNANATYVSVATAGSTVTFTATSANNTANKVYAAIDTDGKFVPTAWSYTSEFQ